MSIAKVDAHTGDITLRVKSLLGCRYAAFSFSWLFASGTSAGAECSFFLEKLAPDWKVVPQNAAEEEQLLELAAMLRHQKEAAERQGSGNSFLTEACDSLRTAVAGLGGPALPTSYDHHVKQAAAQRLQDPRNCQAMEQWGTYLIQLTEMANAA